MKNDQKKKRIFKGVVFSAKAPKTLVVKVARAKTHPKYLKQYFMDRKYKVHDEKGYFKEGDKIEFVECRPLSREKRWRVLYGKNEAGPK